MSKKESFPITNLLICELRDLIEQSRQQLALTVNTAMSMLYWQVGKRINEEILKNQRAEYGERIIKSLSSQLTSEYGIGWSEKQLRHCLRFAETMPDFQIVSALWRQLSWTHIKTLIYIENSLKRDFYMEICRIEKWSTRVLQEHIELLHLDKSNIKVAEYLTKLPDLKLLRVKLHQAIERAKNK